MTAFDEIYRAKEDAETIYVDLQDIGERLGGISAQQDKAATEALGSVYHQLRALLTDALFATSKLSKAIKVAVALADDELR